jgi:tRNA dimethylallyltransferase
LAFALAKEIGAEIVSVDSMQIYKDMDIGTDKPSKETRKEIPHHMIDIVTPDKNFSVALFQKLARQAIEDILKRRKKVVLVGGSGLYFRAVVDPLCFPEGDIDSPLRKELEKELAEKGSDYLYNLLLSLDPEACSFLPPNDVRRIIRALEIIKSQGLLYSDLRKNWRRYQSIYNLKVIGLTCSRKVLYQKIEKRVDRMMERGFLEEVKNLMDKYNLALTPSQALGYKELISYLKGKVSLEESLKLIKRRTRHFAKRQIVWYKADPRVNWIDVQNFPGFEELLSYSLSLIFD